VWSCGDRGRLGGEACGIPHLAKNERDVGHPAVAAGMESKTYRREENDIDLSNLPHNWAAYYLRALPLRNISLTVATK
jgi:hypothetical protein